MPIRRHLLLVAAVTAVALATIGALVIVWLSARASQVDADDHLDGVVSDVVVAIESDRIESTRLISGGHDEFIRVLDQAGRVVASTEGYDTASVALPTTPADGERRDVVAGESISPELDGRYLVHVSSAESSAGETFVVQAFVSVDETEGARLMRNGLIATLAVLAALDALLIGLLVRRVLSPIDTMRTEVERIETTDLSGRIELPGGDDELTRLGNTLNHLLERLEDGAARQKRFSAAASHELRSPLSSIRTQLEVGLRYPDRANWRTIAAESLVEIDRLEELSRDLRTITRAWSLHAATERFDLGELVSDEVGRRVPPRGVTYSAHLSSAPVLGAFDDITRMVRNLLDNAERHAVNEIEVVVASEAHAVTLSISNDGKAIPADQHERVFEPFMRLDEARAYDDGGSGLGLAIARSVMEANKGTLRSEHRPTGARFVACFPSPV
jgi:signal transduction histidine kinase